MATLVHALLSLHFVDQCHGMMMMKAPLQSESLAAFWSDNLTAFGSKYERNAADPAKPHIILGVGFPKCGSHFSWEVMAQHPDVITGYEKELKYFEFEPLDPECSCRKPKKKFNQQKYTAAQVYANLCYGGDFDKHPGKKLLEFSPGYAALENPKLDHTLARIKMVDDTATVRIVYLMRDPVERARSEINMFRDAGRINGSDKDLSKMLMQQVYDGGYHVTTGHYAAHFAPWLSMFPKEQILVVNTGALSQVETWKRIFAHVGLVEPKDEWIKMTVQSVHDNGRKEKDTYLELGDKAKQALSSHYAEHDQTLWKLLGTEPWW